MAKHTDSSKIAASARKARARNVRLIKAFSFFAVVCLAFVGGFFVRGEIPLLES